MISWALPVNLLSSECYKTPMLHWWYFDVSLGKGLVLCQFLNQYWPRSVPPYGVTKPHWFKWNSQGYHRATQITRFMGPTWGPRWAPCWPHAFCYQGIYLPYVMLLLVWPRKQWADFHYWCLLGSLCDKKHVGLSLYPANWLYWIFAKVILIALTDLDLDKMDNIFADHICKWFFLDKNTIVNANFIEGKVVENMLQYWNR